MASIDGMKDVYEDVVSLIGHTPIVRLNRMAKDLGATFYVKMEYLNPGSSVKDRIALQMILDAEEAGDLRPGGTIVECTSGNTGMGLAMVGAARGYRSVLVMPDKVSDEKIKSLRAFGARVVTTPTAVPPDDPRSYYCVARRIAEETPGGWLANQYQNPSNPKAHMNTTGPEIWEQMGSILDVVVIAAGTGGTITGVGRYLKGRKPEIQVVAVDPEGSVYYDYWRTGKVTDDVKGYKVEGFGEDFLPGTIDFKVIDEVVQVSDRECFLTARELTRLEGIFTGGSGGGAVCGAMKYARAHPDMKNILILVPDSGSRYLSKVFDDQWMRENSFLEVESQLGTVGDLVKSRNLQLVTAAPGDSVSAVIGLMKKHGISQVPVLEKGKLLGIIEEASLLKAMLEDPATVDHPVADMVAHHYSLVDTARPVSELASICARGHVALVQDEGEITAIVTNIDLIDYLSSRL